MWAAVAELDRLEKVRLYVSELEFTAAVKTPVPSLRIGGTSLNPVKRVRRLLSESARAMLVLPIKSHAITGTTISSLVCFILASCAESYPSSIRNRQAARWPPGPQADWNDPASRVPLPRFRRRF